MAIDKLDITLIGDAPLIMHNGQTADPMNHYAKALTELRARRKKTDADHEEIRHLEWRASIYHDDAGVIGFPADNVLAMVIEGAKKLRLGKDAKAAVVEGAPFFPVDYEGPRDLEKLYADKRFVDVRRQKTSSGQTVISSRVCFPVGWSIPISLQVINDIMDTRRVIECIEIAGERVGLGASRPRFGRFHIHGS